MKVLGYENDETVNVNGTHLVGQIKTTYEKLDTYPNNMCMCVCYILMLLTLQITILIKSSTMQKI